MFIGDLTVDRGIAAPAAALTAATRAAAGPAGGSTGGGGDSSDSAETVAITILRKALEAAQLTLQRLERSGADDRALEAARERVVEASAALAQALTDQAQEAARAARSTTSTVDLYA